MTETVIEVIGLRKSYGDFEALKGIDVTVHAGEVFCLLGPNGAGKTTTVEILEGHRDCDAGEVRVLGHDPQRHDRALKARIRSAASISRWRSPATPTCSSSMSPQAASTRPPAAAPGR